jgi:hypothetical protein
MKCDVCDQEYGHSYEVKHIKFVEKKIIHICNQCYYKLNKHDGNN